MASEKSYGALDDGSPAPGYTEHPTGDAEAPPPTYNDTQNSAPPPSYDSLFGQIKDARENSHGRGAFLKNVCFIIFSTIGFTIFIGIMMILPVSMIVIGAVNLDNCKAERFIPIWLVVSGCVSGVMQLISIFKKTKAKCEGREENEDMDENPLLNGISGLIGCFNIAWFFAGNVWVYRMYPPSNTNDPVGNNYCDATTYYFSFWLITVAYIILALICCCSCCIALGGKK